MELKALLVCTDGSATQLLSRILAEQEIAAEHAPGADAALAMVADRRFDALILDTDDPAHAQEILSKARLSKPNCSTLVIALVGSTSNVREFFSRGANFVLYKPLSEERARVSLKAARALMRRERRRTPRIPVYTSAEIAYSNVEESSSTILDVSEEGAAIQSESKLPPSCKVYFQFTLPGQPKLVRLSGEIAWQDSSGRVGIRFVDVPQASRRVLKEWLLHNDFRKEPNSGQRPAPVAPATPKPSDPAEALQRFRSSPGNRRGESRHACTLGAEVHRLGNSVPNRCTLSDIGSGGCYVEMPSPFEPQTAVEIIVRAQNVKIRVCGTVQSVHPGFGMGVRFTLKSASEREHVEQLVSLVSGGTALEPKAF
jgi:DNA-binding NarL/FixJ family response regulator